MDFESKKIFTKSNGNKLIDDFKDGNTISKTLLRESQYKFIDSKWHGHYIQFQLQNGTFPAYVFNRNLIGIGKFIVNEYISVLRGLTELDRAGHLRSWQ